MAFINEYASEEDAKKYSLKEVFYKAGTRFGLNITDWTVEHAREMYLFKVGIRDRDDPGVKTFFIYWHGHLLDFDTRVNGEGGYKVAYCLSYSNLNLRLPIELKALRNLIVADIKEALVVYQDAGILTRDTGMTVKCFFG